MRQFDILSAKVYFEDTKEFKNRPVLYLKTKNNMIVARKITSKNKRGNYKGEYELQDWKEAGLRLPSVVRMSKHLLIKPEEVDRVIGHLSERDIEGVRKLINTPYKESYNEDDDIDYILQYFL